VQSVFDAVEAPDRPLSGGTAICISFGNVAEVPPVKETVCLIVRGLRLWQQWSDASPIALEDLLATVVTPIRKHCDMLLAINPI
jgi:hypothetical protein